MLSTDMFSTHSAALGTFLARTTDDPGHGIIWWIIVGLIAGWLTGRLMKGSGFGALMDIIVGIVGALIGGFAASHLGFGGPHGMVMTIILAIIGAVVLTLIIRLITGNRSANL